MKRGRKRLPPTRQDTFVWWRKTNSEGRSIALCRTRFTAHTKALNSGTLASPFFLWRVEAHSENGKEGVLSCRVEDIRLRAPEEDDLKEIVPVVNEWLNGNIDVIVSGPKTEEELKYGNIWVLVRPIGKVGFCETIIRLVSSLAIALGASKGGWLAEAMTVHKTTFVLSGDKWVELTKYWASKYPIQVRKTD